MRNGGVKQCCGGIEQCSTLHEVSTISQFGTLVMMCNLARCLHKDFFNAHIMQGGEVTRPHVFSFQLKYFEVLLSSAFWTSRGQLCRPLSLPRQSLSFLSREFSIPSSALRLSSSFAKTCSCAFCHTRKRHRKYVLGVFTPPGFEPQQPSCPAELVLFVHQQE